MAIRITPEQLPGALRRLDADLRRGLERAMKRAARDGAALLKVASPNEIGFFKRSWRVAGTRITNDAPYSGFVELGMRPRKLAPSEMDALRAWADKHFRRIRQDTHREAKVAFVVHDIAKRIAEKGIRPTYFVQGKLDTLRWIAQTAVNAELAAVSGRAGA